MRAYRDDRGRRRAAQRDTATQGFVLRRVLRVCGRRSLSHTRAAVGTWNSLGGKALPAIDGPTVRVRHGPLSC
jgi:hypothetical protein